MINSVIGNDDGLVVAGTDMTGTLLLVLVDMVTEWVVVVEVDVVVVVRGDTEVVVEVLVVVVVEMVEVVVVTGVILSVMILTVP